MIRLLSGRMRSWESRLVNSVLAASSSFHGVRVELLLLGEMYLWLQEGGIQSFGISRPEEFPLLLCQEHGQHRANIVPARR